MELISKKDLLQRYGISYGALYRWKRKGLIPEEWFVKKSTVTGQETFFPQDLICQRVELILSQKEEISLDDLSRQIREKKQAHIVIKTSVTEHFIPIEELESVIFVDDNDNHHELTALVKQLCYAES